MRPRRVEYTVYIDVVFAVNTIMDFVILLILNRVLSYGTNRKRMLAGAVVGGSWACLAAAFPKIPMAVRAFGTYIAVSSLMASISYKLKKPGEILQAVAGIYLVSVVMGGVMVVLWEHTRAGGRLWRFLGGGIRIPFLAWIFLVAGGVFACLGFSECLKGTIRLMAHRRDLCQVTLEYGGRRQQAKGLIDTGNRLREPVSRRPVHVASAGLMEQLCPKVKGVIYVPYQSVGAKNGLLPAIYIDWMEVKWEGGSYRIPHPLIAITKQSLSSGEDYEILIQKSDQGA